MVVHGHVRNGAIVLDEDVSLPEGAPVQVSIERSSEESNGATNYKSWLDGLAGRWQGDFVRGDEGDFETRESLS